MTDTPSDADLRAEILSVAEAQGWPELRVHCPWPQYPGLRHFVGPGRTLFLTDIEFWQREHLLALSSALAQRNEQS